MFREGDLAPGLSHGHGVRHAPGQATIGTQPVDVHGGYKLDPG